MSLTVAQITDLHLDEPMAEDAGADSRRNVERVLGAVEAQGIKDLVLTGDIGLSASHRWLLELITGHGLKPLFALGNHDELADFKKLAVTADFVKPDGLYYTVSMDGIDCVFLDSSSRRVGEEQLFWLESVLSNAASDLVVFVHHPVLDCGNTTLDRLYPLENRDRLREIFMRSGKRISIFCGHYHTEHEQKGDYISQYVTPSTVLQIKKQSERPETESTNFGYRLIRLSENEIDTEMVWFNV